MRVSPFCSQLCRRTAPLAARRGKNKHPAGAGVHRVHAGHVQRHRVEGGEHTHVGYDGHIVLRTAVAVGGHVDDQRNVEAGASATTALVYSAIL